MTLKDRYRVDLAELQAICEANYARLLRLLPEHRQAGLQRRISTGDEDGASELLLEVIEVNPYTTSLLLQHVHAWPWSGPQTLEVRLYHDARLAEVISRQHRPYLGHYDYPNAAMYQPDEKHQLNLFLGEWLGHCQTYGYESQAVADW